jgi:lipid-binding SYLF domain-containing protein
MTVYTQDETWAAAKMAFLIGATIGTVFGVVLAAVVVRIFG